MVSRIHRFDFGSLRDFRGPVVMEALKQAEHQEIDVTPPPPVFTEADLEAARIAGKKDGYAEGFLAGKQDAQKSFDQKTSDAQEVLHQLGEVMKNLSNRYQKLLLDESAELTVLITAIAKKVAGDALAKDGEKAILALVEKCLPVVFSKPRLIIELNPNVFATTLDRIETMLCEAGVEAEIQFRANEALGLSDIRLDWGSGQMERNTTALWNEIDAIVGHINLAPTLTELPQEQQ